MMTAEEMRNGRTEGEMARQACLNILGLMTIKWVIIFGVTRAVRKAVEKAS